MRVKGGFTRRGMGAMFAGLALPRGTARAQTPGPADELKAARERLAQQARTIRAVKIPAETEPAFQFKA